MYCVFAEKASGARAASFSVSALFCQDQWITHLCFVADQRALLLQAFGRRWVPYSFQAYLSLDCAINRD